MFLLAEPKPDRSHFRRAGVERAAVVDSETLFLARAQIYLA